MNMAGNINEVNRLTASEIQLLTL